MDPTWEDVMSGDTEGVGAAILTELRTLNETMSGVRERLAAQEQSNRGVWKEVRQVGRDTRRLTERLPDVVAEGIARHEANCLPRQAAIRKLRNGSSVAPPPAPQTGREDSRVVVVEQATGAEPGSVNVPRVVVLAGCLLGIGAAVTVFVLHLVGVVSF